MGDKMDDLALALDGAVDRHHPGRKDYAALPFIEFWPDHEIGDASLVLDGDEDDAFAPAIFVTTSPWNVRSLRRENIRKKPADFRRGTSLTFSIAS